MNTFDILVFVSLAWGLINGLRKGFVIAVSRLLALGLGLFGAFLFSGKAALYVAEHIQTSPQILNAIGFLILFVLIVIAVSALAKALTKVLKLAALGLINRLLGGFFGVLKWGLILSALVLVYEQINEIITLLPTNLKEDSFSYAYLLEFGEFCFEWVLGEFAEQNPDTLL